MKALQLKINDQLYDTLLAMLKGLPEKDIEIIESNENVNSIQKKQSKIVSNKLSANSLRGCLQHTGKIIPTELLCKPVEYDNDSIWYTVSFLNTIDEKNYEY